MDEQRQNGVGRERQIGDPFSYPGAVIRHVEVDDLHADATQREQVHEGCSGNLLLDQANDELRGAYRNVYAQLDENILVSRVVDPRDGALHVEPVLRDLRSDEVRREVIGGSLQGTSEWLSDHFSTSNTTDTYHEMIRRAQMLAEMGESVILDATWTSAPLREMAVRAAGDARCAHLALRCDAPAHVAEHRVARRIAAGTDISMATVAIARRISESFDPWPDAAVIPTGQPIAETLTEAITAVGTALEQCRAQDARPQDGHVASLAADPPPFNDAADARLPSVRASNHRRRDSLHAPLTDSTDRARGERLR